MLLLTSLHSVSPFFLHSLTSLAFWKCCNFLGINLCVALLFILVLQVMDGDMYREDFLIISILSEWDVSWVKK